MALAVDASTPARASGTTSQSAATTPGFNPPAVSVLIACVGTDNSNNAGSPTAAMTNSGTALSWTRVADSNKSTGGQAGGTDVWWAPVPAALTGLTVTATVSTTSGSAIAPSLKVYVVTGAAGSPIGAHVALGATTQVAAPSFTTTGAASLGIACGTDWNNKGTPTSTDLTVDTWDIATSTSGLSGYKVLGVAGSTAAANLTAGASGPAWNVVWLEVLAASGSSFTGSVTQTLGVTSTATGQKRATGAAASTLGVTSSATGHKAASGSVTTMLGVTTVVSGGKRSAGAVSTALGVSGAASGVRRAVGAVSTTLGLSTVAAGVRRAVGAVSTALDLRSTAVTPSAGAVTTVLGLTATAAGEKRAGGSMVTMLGLESTAGAAGPVARPVTVTVRPASQPTTVVPVPSATTVGRASAYVRVRSVR